MDISETYTTSGIELGAKLFYAYTHAQDTVRRARNDHVQMVRMRGARQATQRTEHKITRHKIE